VEKEDRVASMPRLSSSRRARRFLLVERDVDLAVGEDASFA